MALTYLSSRAARELLSPKACPHLLPPPLCHQEFNYRLEKKDGANISLKMRLLGKLC